MIISCFPSLEELDLTLNSPKENNLRVLSDWMNHYSHHLKCLKLHLVKSEKCPLIESIYQSVAEHCVSLKELGLSVWEGCMEIITQGNALQNLTTLTIFNAAEGNQSHEITTLYQARQFANQLQCLCISGCDELMIDDLVNVLASFPSCTKLDWKLFDANFIDEDETNADNEDEEEEIHENNIVRFFTTLMTHENLKQLQQLNLRLDFNDKLETEKDYYDLTTDDEEVVKQWHFQFPHLTYLHLTFPFVLNPWIHSLLHIRLLKNCPHLEYLYLQFNPEEVGGEPKFQGKIEMERLRTSLLQ